MTAGRAWRLALLLAALALPLVLSDYRAFQLTQALIYAIALLGLVLLTGYSGQISLGHGAFYALGAYAAAILSSRWGAPSFLAVPAAGGLAFLAGYAFGWPALRLRGLYLALATLSLALALPQLLRFDALEGLTGGVQGLHIDKPQVPFGLPLSQDQWLFYVALAVLVLLMGMARNLVGGRMGRALLAIRDRALAAEAVGVDTARLKTLTFAAGALCAGVAGALSAFTVNFVSPDAYDLFLSIAFLVGLVVGGITSIGGTIVGGLFLVFVPNVAQGISDAAPWAVYGVILIALMFAMPDGAAGLAARLKRRIAQLRKHMRLS